MGTERCRDLNTTFCRRFLPPQAPTGHALLLDWDGHIAFTPEAADLHRCLTEYATLVEQATRDDPCDLLSVRDASEVTLAYLYRGLDAGRPLPEAANLRRLTLLLRRILRASAEWFGTTRWNDEMKWYDGFKAPDAIVSLLDTLAESDAFRRRFLPTGPADAHGLLVDFQHDVPFTPSAAELQQCLEAYTALLRTATRVTCMPVRWCVEASELALAYLSRAVQNDVPLPERDTSNSLVGLIRKTLGDAVTLFGAMRWYDGFKRIDILAWLLEEHAPKGLQGWHVFRARLRQTLRIG
ncbi:MAG TPA: hypothetical protein VKA46_01285 [Gemmataceae bacterium]|nr:hypothetical protein [Gemmataceae bacterium]